jgi:hypothetical protein
MIADVCKSIGDQAKRALDQAKAYSEEAAAAAVCSCCGERPDGKAPECVKDVNLVTQTALMRLQIPIFKCDRFAAPLPQSSAYHRDAVDSDVEEEEEGRVELRKGRRHEKRAL